MKKIIVALSAFALPGFIIAQNNVGISNDLKTVAQHNLDVNSSAISTFSSGNVKGTQYLFDDWTPGSVTDETNNTFSDNYSFNFDKINHDVYARDNIQKISVVLDKTKVKRFKIGQLNFVNAELIDQKGKNLFYQVLVEEPSKISLYKLTKTRFQRANPNDMSNVKSGNFSSEFIDDVTYYVMQGKELTRVNLTGNSIHKALKSQSDKLNKYEDQNSTKEIDEDFLVGLIKYLNS